jgi:iron complex transport system substrate-binding protein
MSALWATACAPAAALQKVQEAEQALEPSSSEVSADAAQQELVFTDDLGNELRFAQYPQAIVSLSPSTTEILFAVGAGGQMVGRDEMSNYPAEALALESVGAMWGELPVESILAAEPDLVVVAQIISAETVAALQDLGLQVYWQANPATFDDLYQNLRDLATLTGNADQVEALIADLQTRVTAVETIVAEAESTPSVFYELDATDPANPWTAGSGTFMDYIISLAGGSNVASMLEGDYAQISSEMLITANPEVIVLADAPFGVTPESVAQRAGWSGIAAVANKAVFPFDPETLSIPGPRLVDGLEAMARLLHPQLFE